METKQISKNIMITVLAQIVSLFVSFILGFIVPKFISELSYSYWQTFLLYMGYVSIFQFGLLDGFLLRYAQYDYGELDKPLVRSQFFILIVVLTVFSLLGFLFSIFYLQGVYKLVGILLCIGMITKNSYTYTSYLLQSTNRIYHYAKAVIVQRLGYALFVVILIVTGVKNFVWFCIAELFGDGLSVLYGFFVNKGLFFAKEKVSLKSAVFEAGKNISAGFLMMLAGFSSAFLILGAKTVVQWRWDELVFGKVSFAFSLYGVFCSFIVAVGVVLFPSFKRMEKATLPNVFYKVRKELEFVFFVLLLFYYPLYVVIGFWIPSYQEALRYFSVLFPGVLFYSKVHLLTNNYLKIYRKEKIIFLLNLATVVVGLLAYVVGAYVFNRLIVVLVSVVVFSMSRSLLSELIVMKELGKLESVDFIVEFFLSGIFVIATRYCSFILGLLIYIVTLVGYAIVYRKLVAQLIKKIQLKLRKSQ